mgnify:CR=1 FL=1
MRLVKRKGIIHRIADKIEQAELDGEEVEKVVLNRIEWRQLCRAVDKIRRDHHPSWFVHPADQIMHQSGVIRRDVSAYGRYYLDDIPIEPEDKQ